MTEKEPTIILAVDDDEMSLKLLLTILTQEKYKVMLAFSGIEALNLLHNQKQNPNLILMDMMMPNVNGLETTRRIKAIERFSAIPIIMVTGNSHKRVVTNCLKAGASDFVVKPFNRETLLDKIRKALNNAEEESLGEHKSWKKSELMKVSYNAALQNRPIIEISWIQLKPGMEVESIYFGDKLYIRNCIVDYKIIKLINELVDENGIRPVIKILLPKRQI